MAALAAGGIGMLSSTAAMAAMETLAMQSAWMAVENAKLEQQKEQVKSRANLSKGYSEIAGNAI